MKLQYECLTCIIAQVLNVAKMLNFDEAHKEAAMRESLAYLSGANYEGCTPDSMGVLWELLLKHAETGDPYAAVKSLCNQEAMKMESHVRQAILTSNDPFGRVLKFAVAGNLVDYGLEHPVSLEEQNRQVDEIAATPFVVDDSFELKEVLRKSETLLYLCDNAGEILFDKLLIEETAANSANSVNMRRLGNAVLNDVTWRTHWKSAGQCWRVIDKGDGCPARCCTAQAKHF